MHVCVAALWEEWDPAWVVRSSEGSPRISGMCLATQWDCNILQQFRRRLLSTFGFHVRL